MLENISYRFEENKAMFLAERLQRRMPKTNSLASPFSSKAVLLGILYGGFVAAAYFLVRLRGVHGGLEIFTLGCFISFFLHLLVVPRKAAIGLRDPRMFVRGLFYGLAQVFIFKAQYDGQTSGALVAAVFGSVIAVVLGHFLLKERPSRLAILAIVLAFSGFFIDLSLFMTSSWGIAGGLVQGLSIVTVRWLMKNKHSQQEAISVGFLLGGIVGLLTLTVSGELSLISQIHLVDMLWAVPVMFITQYFYFYLIKILDAPRSSILVLTRIPWAMGLEFAVLGIVASVNQVLASACVVLAAAILVVDSANFFQSRQRKF